MGTRSCGSKDTRVDVLQTVDAPENNHIGIRASSLKWWQDQKHISSVSTPMHTPWMPNRRSRKLWCSTAVSLFCDIE